MAGGKASPASSVWAVGAVCVHILHGKSLIKVIKTANIHFFCYLIFVHLNFSIFVYEHSFIAAVFFVLLSLLMFVFAIAKYISFNIMSLSMFVVSIIANLSNIS